MKLKTNYFLIGVFVITGVVALVAGVLTVGASTFASRGLLVESYFAESVQGLEKGAVVRFRGVRIGVVTEIRLVSQLYTTDRPYAAVRCLLDPTDVGLDVEGLRERILQRVTEGFRVRLASQGLTGALYLETDLVDDAKLLADALTIDWTPSQVYVPSVPSRIARIGSSLEDVMTSLENTDFAGIAEDGKSTLRALQTAVEDLDPKTFKTEFTALTTSAREAVDDVRNRLASLFERADRVLGHAEQVVAAIDAARLTRTLDELGRVADTLPNAVARFDTAMAGIDTAAADFRGEVNSNGRVLAAVLAELRQASTHLAGLADTLERYPSLLLIGNPPPRTEPRK